LSWIADRPGVIAPIVGARTVEHLRNNLGAAELTLDNQATAALEKVSAPQFGGYPYGAFGASQRVRWLQDGTPAPTQPYTAGSDHPTGHASNPITSPLNYRGDTSAVLDQGSSLKSSKQTN
jgi:hypothetical protein